MKKELPSEALRELADYVESLAPVVEDAPLCNEEELERMIDDAVAGWYGREQEGSNGTD